MAKSNVVHISRNRIVAEPAKPTRTVNGKPLTAAQNAARDARNEKLRLARAAKKAEMMSKLPVFGEVVPSDGVFAPVPAPESAESLIQPISTLGTLVAEQSVEPAEDDSRESWGLAAKVTYPGEEKLTGFAPYVQTNGTVHVEGTAVEKRATAPRKTERRWAISDGQKKLNTLFRAFRKAGLAAAQNDDLAALQQNQVQPVAAVCYVLPQKKWEGTQFGIQCTMNAELRVSEALIACGFEATVVDADGARTVFAVTGTCR